MEVASWGYPYDSRPGEGGIERSRKKALVLIFEIGEDFVPSATGLGGRRWRGRVPYFTPLGEGWHIRRAEKSWKNEPQGYTFYQIPCSGAPKTEPQGYILPVCATPRLRV